MMWWEVLLLLIAIWLFCGAAFVTPHYMRYELESKQDSKGSET